MFNIPFFKKIYFNDLGITIRDHPWVIDEEQIMNHKLRQFPNQIKRVKFNNSWLWGKINQKYKYGIKITVFLLGGIHLNDDKDISGLFQTLFKTYRPLYIDIISSKTNSDNDLFKGLKKLKSRNGFIFFDLNSININHINLMAGALDVF